MPVPAALRLLDYVWLSAMNYAQLLYLLLSERYIKRVDIQAFKINHPNLMANIYNCHIKNYDNGWLTDGLNDGAGGAGALAG